ncbi:MAG: PIN domain-containing protein [Chitinispirillales bacterium]|nr:PIN domain-containing protein [Chitinispirillales bacterium]
MNRKLIIYLDTCCYSRLFDVTDQIDVIEEAGRIRYVMRNSFYGKYRIIGSFAVVSEISQNPKKERRRIEKLYNLIKSGEAQVTTQCGVRAQELQSKGLKVMDSLHLAAAEEAGADYLLTVDKEFIKKCSRPNFTTVKVINPINF